MTLTPALVPFREGKRKEAMGEVTLVAWSRHVEFQLSIYYLYDQGQVMLPL